jgi:hypothetical protein
MIHCRMCSARLPRSGRLCRECEFEIDRARATAESNTGLSSLAPLIDDSRLIDGIVSQWSARLHSPIMLVVALAVGVTTAAALHVVQRPHVPTESESVMIGRDLTGIRARSLPMSGAASRSGDSAAAASPSIEKLPSARRDAEPPDPVIRTFTTTATAAPSPAVVATSEASSGSYDYDRVLGLARELDRCARESPFVRIACDEQAHIRYCDRAGSRIPQCALQNARDDRG